MEKKQKRNHRRLTIVSFMKKNNIESTVSAITHYITANLDKINKNKELIQKKANKKETGFLWTIIDEKNFLKYLKHSYFV